jgi:murein DD-endopeptidase MepM/ murein hydrolase activator NlpD
MEGRRIRSTAAALALVALAATSLQMGPVAAQDVIAEASPEEQVLFERYDAHASQVADLAGRVERSSLVLGAAEADLDAAQQRADGADWHLAEVRARITEAERRLGEEEQRLRNKAIRAYIGGREETARPVAEVLASSGSIVELGSRMAYSQAVVVDQRATVTRVTEARDTVRGLRAQAEQLQTTAADERDEVARHHDEVRHQHDELELLRQWAAVRGAQDLALVGEVVARGQDHSRRTAGTRKTSDSIARQLLTRQYGGAFEGPTVGHLDRPVRGARFSSGFGLRADPVTGEPARHEGIDFTAPEGTPIIAPADGVVIFTGDVDGYGTLTVVDHGHGLGTLYGHQSSILVVPGQAVVRGELLGTVGNTGKSTGPHLHFEVRLFGVPEEPRPYLGP